MGHDGLPFWLATCAERNDYRIEPFDPLTKAFMNSS